MSKAAGLRQALAEVGRHLPSNTLDNDADVASDGVAFRNQRRINTDGAVQSQWKDALKRLESNAYALFPGEEGAQT